MTKQANVTVLTDENGMQREYVEVKRKARVGERIKIVDKVPNEGRYKNGDIFTVGNTEGTGVFAETPYAYVLHSEYVVLEPTSTVIIDGVRYAEEKRKARVSDRILITNRDAGEDRYNNGDVFTVARLDYDGDVRVNGDDFDDAYVTDDEYTVLTPIDAPKAAGPMASAQQTVINLAITVNVQPGADVAQAVADAVKAEMAKWRESI